MIALFVDTTSNLIRICLNKDNEFYYVEKESLMDHSSHVLSLINELLNNNGVNVNEINKMIVCNGPGSFTGIRIGVTICKTIAYCLNIPITTISSLEILGLNGNCVSLIYDNNDKYYYGIYKGNDVFEEGLDSKDNILEKARKLDLSVLYSKNKIEDLDVIVENDFKNEIFSYCEDKELVNPHHVNPYYLKLTSAELNLLNDK